MIPKHAIFMVEQTNENGLNFLKIYLLCSFASKLFTSIIIEHGQFLSNVSVAESLYQKQCIAQSLYQHSLFISNG